MIIDSTIKHKDLGKTTEWNGRKIAGAPTARKGDIITMILKFNSNNAN